MISFPSSSVELQLNQVSVIPSILDCNFLQDAPGNPPEDFLAPYYISVDHRFSGEKLIDIFIVES